MLLFSTDDEAAVGRRRRSGRHGAPRRHSACVRPVPPEIIGSIVTEPEDHELFLPDSGDWSTRADSLRMRFWRRGDRIVSEPRSSMLITALRRWRAAGSSPHCSTEYLARAAAWVSGWLVFTGLYAPSIPSRLTRRSSGKRMSRAAGTRVTSSSRRRCSAPARNPLARRERSDALRRYLGMEDGRWSGGLSMRRALALGILLFWPCSSGCAIGNSGLPGSKSAIIRAYSRNAVVGVPTLVGNTVGALIAAPALIALNKYNLYQPDAPGYWVAWTAAGPVYFLGGVTGTPFLPFSLLRPEQRIWICGRHPGNRLRYCSSGTRRRPTAKSIWKTHCQGPVRFRSSCWFNVVAFSCPAAAARHVVARAAPTPITCLWVSRSVTLVSCGQPPATRFT